MLTAGLNTWQIHYAGTTQEEAAGVRLSSPNARSLFSNNPKRRVTRLGRAARALLRGAQLLVRSIAQRRTGGLLALAPPHGGFLRGLKFHRLQAGAFVRAIAKGLLGSATASAPPIGSSLDFEGQRFVITDNRYFRHPDTLHSSGQRAIANSENFPPGSPWTLDLDGWRKMSGKRPDGPMAKVGGR